MVSAGLLSRFGAEANSTRRVRSGTWTQKVDISPLPLMGIGPRETKIISGACCCKYCAACPEQWILFFSELDSMREAVFTVSPKRQYRGFRVPTTFATTGPEWK